MDFAASQREATFRACENFPLPQGEGKNSHPLSLPFLKGTKSGAPHGAPGREHDYEEHY